MILNKKFEGLNILTLSDRMNKLYPNSGQTRIKTSPGQFRESRKDHF